MFAATVFLIPHGEPGDYDVPTAFPSDVRAERRPAALPPRRAPSRREAKAALRAIERVWGPMFERVGDEYEPAELVLMDSTSADPCEAPGDWAGLYCIGDDTIYLDVAASGGSWAYVLAHEVGHHVQQQRGVFAETEDDYIWHPRSSTDLHRREELQAECYAGVWAYAVDAPRTVFASTHVDFDRTGRAHARWFRRGRASGRPGRCDTF
ncbi:MAG TPA: neutral zinc metallopeptidase, partial [Solirubrobacteraceae bacterium]